MKQAFSEIKNTFLKCEFISNCIKIVHPLYQKRTISYSDSNICIVNRLYFNPACDWGVFLQNHYIMLFSLKDWIKINACYIKNV